MRSALTFGLLVVAALTTASCASMETTTAAAPAPLNTIDASRFFAGRWYEIARTPMSLTDGCVAGTTDYFTRPDGTLIDRDACRMGTPGGKEKVYQGPVTIVDPGANNKVVVRYIVYGFIPVPRNYIMLDRGADYSWFIVTNPAFDMMSIFTRAPRPSTAEVAQLTARARALGYTKPLEYPAQFPPGSR